LSAAVDVVSLSADLDISVNVRGIVGTYLLRTYTVGTAVDLVVEMRSPTTPMLCNVR
jgi:hypothetical protein